MDGVDIKRAGGNVGPLPRRIGLAVVAVALFGAALLTYMSMDRPEAAAPGEPAAPLVDKAAVATDTAKPPATVPGPDATSASSVPDQQRPISPPAPPAPAVGVAAKPAAEPAVAPAPTAPEPAMAPTAEATPPIATSPVTTRPATTPPTMAGVLDRIGANLAARPCDILRTVDDGGTLVVRGVTATSDGLSSLGDLIDAAAVGVPHRLAVTTASPALCEPLTVIRDLRAGNAGRRRGVEAMAPVADGLFVGGDDLMIDIRSPDFTSYLTVDYYTLDGSVVHLLPNRLQPPARVPAGGLLRIGDRTADGRYWTIGAPFGTELVVVIASAAPLFPEPRLEAETARGYLTDLKRALEVATGEPKPVAAALAITTAAR